MRKVLGIETSCDETAAAVVTEDREILSNAVLSQQEHKKFGGVVPEIAARAHLNHIDRLIKRALAAARLTLDEIDAVAATAGPGLIGGVMVGAMTAKAIAAVQDIPIIAVNHLEGHALTVRLVDDVTFPYLLLLVSGGHCQLLIVKDVGDYDCLGATRDDAAGECFDKTAKLLGLGYPGGPAVEKMALACEDPAAALKKFPLPTPMVGKTGCDFSFSGLKTAVRQTVDKIARPSASGVEQVIDRPIAADICHSFQHSVGEIFADRTEHAITAYLAHCAALPAPQQNPTLVIAGGVAANAQLRRRLEALAERYKMRFAAAPAALCTDNAAMIAWAGMERLMRGLTDTLDFTVRPRWPLDTLKGRNHV